MKIVVFARHWLGRKVTIGEPRETISRSITHITTETVTPDPE